MAGAVSLTANREEFERFLSALFEPADMVQLEGYPKPNTGKGPAGRYVCEAGRAAGFCAQMERKNNAPTWANWYIRTNPVKPGLKGSATENDVAYVRALHLDVDDLTCEQFMSRVRDMGWPEPHVVVRSGGVGRENHTGAQAWYLLETPVQVAAAPELAGRVKQIIAAMLEACGGDVGTQNLSRLMRPPGFWNVKYPDKHQPRRAELYYCEPENERVTLADFVRLLDVPDYQAAAAPPATSPAKKAGGDDYDGPEPILDDILKGCAFMRHCRDDAATLAEPEWYRMLTIAANCRDGVVKCHELSAPHPDYRAADTEAKIRHALAATAPYSCDDIGQTTGGQWCEECEHRGRIKSPITLGYPRKRAPVDDAIAAAEKTIATWRTKHAEAEDAADAVLGMLDDEKALQAAGLLRWHKPAAVQALLIELGQRGVKAAFVKRLDETITRETERQSKIAKARERAEQNRAKPIVEMLEGAPIAAEATAPPGWYVGPKGVGEEKESRATGEIYADIRSQTPIMPTGRMIDLETGRVSLALAFLYRKQWRHRLVQRKDAMQATTIIDLADYGADVHSQNKTAVIKYLADFEAHNEAVLPLVEATTHLGWVPGGTRFVCGRQVITPAGRMPLAEGDARQWRGESVGFRVTSEGDEEFLDAYSEARGGTLGGWVEAVKPLVDYPRVQLGIYASLAAPMLRIFQCQSFILEWADQTSTGKTSTLMVAASVCGNCNERSPRTLIRPWYSTAVWITNALPKVQNLPLFLDDTRKAKDPKDIPLAVYTITGGQGKGRGTINQGTQATGSWQTIVLSTGEQRITDFLSGQGGAFMRALCLFGSPWGETSTKAAETIQRVKTGIEANYGHALPAFMEYVCRHRDQWPKWQKAKAESQAAIARDFVEENDGRGVQFAHRMAEYVAVLQITATIAHEALCLPWDPPDMWTELKQALREAATGADVAADALRLAVEDATLRRDNYFDAARGIGEYAEVQTPPGGWRGRWDRTNPGYEYIGFSRAMLADVLPRHGHTVRAAVRAWKDRGWLETAPGGEPSVVTSLGGGAKARLYRVTREAIDEMTGTGGAEG